MNHNEEVPDFLGGLGDMLPADVLKKVNELLERVHRKDKDHQGSPVFIYAPGSQYVDKQFNFGKPHTPEFRPFCLSAFHASNFFCAVASSKAPFFTPPFRCFIR